MQRRQKRCWQGMRVAILWLGVPGGYWQMLQRSLLGCISGVAAGSGVAPTEGTSGSVVLFEEC